MEADTYAGLGRALAVAGHGRAILGLVLALDIAVGVSFVALSRLCGRLTSRQDKDRGLRVDALRHLVVGRHERSRITPRLPSLDDRELLRCLSEEVEWPAASASRLQQHDPLGREVGHLDASAVLAADEREGRDLTAEVMSGAI